MQHTNQSTIRDIWKAFLSRLESDYFVTLTFTRGLPDKEATATLQFFLRCVMKALPKRIRKRTHGAVCVERTPSGKFAGTYHFHMLFCGIEDEKGAYEEKFRTIATKAASHLKSRNGVELAPPKNVHVIGVWDRPGLAKYVTKRGEFPFNRDGLKIWLFDRTGVDHDLPGETAMIWVHTNKSSPDVRDHRKKASFSRPPSSSGTRGNSRAA